MMVYRAMDTVARWGHAGPRAYALDTHIQNKTMLQWMDTTSTYWQQLLNTPHKAGEHKFLPAEMGTSGNECGNLSGIYYGGHKDGALETKWPISITQTTAATLKAHWPHGCAVGFWCDAHAVLRPDGDIDTALFTQAGKPYPVTVGSNWLNGTVESCETFRWPSTSTLWCRNGSSTACTVAPALPPDGLADYGGANNLLECVPTYIHKVASLNAANAWMMRQTAALTSNTSRRQELRGAADKLSELVRTKLYVNAEGNESGGYWACEQPNGELVPVRHVIDFITIGAALLDDLDNATRAEMVAFVKRELLTRNWMRALSVEDEAAPRSDRKDHGPFGAYDGWLGETVQVLSLFGHAYYADALQLVRSMAPVYDRGPGGQSHQARLLPQTPATVTAQAQRRADFE
jgi:hypothetical protein|eukprot:COSAG02_NODE_1027_length_15115_cov_118.186867_9_plen_404_part_00